MAKLLEVIAMAALTACRAEAGLSGEKLNAHIDMTVSEFNAQNFVQKRGHPMPTAGVNWVGYDGGFTLKTMVVGRDMEFPISGDNGGIQISAWSGPRGDLVDNKVNSISFTLSSNFLSRDEALGLANVYCKKVLGYGFSEKNLDGSSKGPRGCFLFINKELFQVSIVERGSDKSEDRFRLIVHITENH